VSHITNDCFGFLTKESAQGFDKDLPSVSRLHEFIQAVFVLNPECDIENSITTLSHLDSNGKDNCEFHRRRLQMMEQLSFLKNRVPVIYHGFHYSSHKASRSRHTR
jgi:hypothetical protein